MSERGNKSDHTDRHNTAVADEVALRIHRTLGPAWIAACSVATGASDIGARHNAASKYGCSLSEIYVRSY
jgi:hypothetical protein